MDSASATRRPSKWLQKWRPGNSVRNPCVQHSWLICKGTQQKYTKLAWLFEGQKKYPPHHVHQSKAQDAHHMYAGHQKYPLQLQIEVDKWGKKAMLATIDLCMFGVCFLYPLRCGPETLLNICTLHSQTWQHMRLQRHSHSLVGTLLQDGRKSTSNTASRHDLTGFELRFKHTEPVLTEIYWHSNGFSSKTHCLVSTSIHWNVSSKFIFSQWLVIGRWFWAKKHCQKTGWYLSATKLENSSTLIHQLTTWQPPSFQSHVCCGFWLVFCSMVWPLNTYQLPIILHL